MVDCKSVDKTGLDLNVCVKVVSVCMDRINRFSVCGQEQSNSGGNVALVRTFHIFLVDIPAVG